MTGVRRRRLPAITCVLLSGLWASCGKDADPTRVDSRRPARDAGSSDLDAGADAADTGAPGLGAISVTLIAAPDGEDSAPGTRDQPTTLTAALERITPGGTVYLRGGTYRYATQITIARDTSGSAGARKTLSQYQHEAPILDFSEQPFGTESNPRGLQIDGDYWRVLGLIVRGSAGSGIYIAGSHNVIERCATYANRGTGLQIGGADGALTAQAPFPSGNLILNCESFDNYDPPPRSRDHADGFAAKRVGTGNVFRGCVAHHNIDDGWDLSTAHELDANGAVWLDQCVAHTNGILLDGTHEDAADREGFKLGGDEIAVAHVVTRSVAYYNGKHGFTWNTNPGELRLSNNLAFDNGEGNYAFGGDAAAAAVLANNVSIWVETGAARADVIAGEDASASNRFWRDGGSGATASDFATVLRLPKLARDAAGNLDLSVFALAPESALIDAGVVPAQLPFDAAYYRGKPDLGAFETR